MSGDLNEDEFPTPTPKEIPSRQRSSQKAIYFAEQCDSHACALLALHNDDAHVLAGELVALGNKLRRWQKVPPSDDERGETTQLFWSLLLRSFRYQTD